MAGELDKIRMALRAKRELATAQESKVVPVATPRARMTSFKQAAKIVGRISDASHDKSMTSLLGVAGQVGLGSASPRNSNTTYFQSQEDLERYKTQDTFSKRPTSADEHVDISKMVTDGTMLSELSSPRDGDTTPKGVISVRRKRRPDAHEMLQEKIEQEEIKRGLSNKESAKVAVQLEAQFSTAIDRVRAWRENPLCYSVLQGEWRHHTVGSAPSV